MRARLLFFFALLAIAGCKLKKSSRECTPVSDGSQILFRVQGPSRIAVGACSGPYTVTSLSERQGQQCSDGSRTEPTPDQSTPVPADIDVSLSMARPSGSFYTDSNCNDAVTSVRVLAGTSSFLFYFKYYSVDFVGDSSVFTIDADSAGYGRGTLDVTVLYPQ